MNVTHVNRMKRDKNHTIISILEKQLRKHLFMIKIKKKKSPKKTKNITEIYQPKIKGVYEKPIADILNGGECFPLKSETRQSTRATTIEHCIRSHSSIRQEKEIEGIQIGK